MDHELIIQSVSQWRWRALARRRDNVNNKDCCCTESRDISFVTTCSEVYFYYRGPDKTERISWLFWWSRESELVPCFSQLRSQEMHSKPLQYPMSSGELLSLALSLSLDDVLSDTLLRYCLLRSPHYAAPRVSAPLKREREGRNVCSTDHNCRAVELIGK